jgi:hypothetical protein
MPEEAGRDLRPYLTQGHQKQRMKCTYHRHHPRQLVHHTGLVSGFA